MENESLKDVILQLAALSGEVSEFAVMQLNSTEKYLTNLLLELRHDNLIKRSDKDCTVGYRLSQSGKKYLVETYPERYGGYFGNGGITSKVRLDGVHRQRYQRMSEINAMMYNIGAAIFPNTKPTFDAPLTVESQSCLSQTSQSWYHTSFEVKDIGEESIKIAGSRAMGLLRCSDGAYLMYHSGNGPIKWEEMTEFRTRTLLSHKLSAPIHAVMMGTDMACALSLLESNGGKLNRYYKVAIDHQSDMYFITQDKNGEFLMRYAVLTDSHRQLKSKVIESFRTDSGNSLMCDGYADDSTGVLFACDFDMVRLVRFKYGLEFRKMKGIVYCFDFQAEVLRRFFGDNVSIKVISSNEIARLFNFPNTANKNRPN